MLIVLLFYFTSFISQNFSSIVIFTIFSCLFIPFLFLFIDILFSFISPFIQYFFFFLMLTYCTSHDSGLVRNLLPRAAMNLETPIMAPLWSSSLSFSKCHAERKVERVCVLVYVFVSLFLYLFIYNLFQSNYSNTTTGVPSLK